MNNFKLSKIDENDCMLRYAINTDFGEFTITEIRYSEESELVVIYHDDEFAIGHCILYGSRGEFDFGHLELGGELSKYYTDDDFEIDEERALKEITEIMNIVCDLHTKAASGDDEIYNILYNLL